MDFNISPLNDFAIFTPQFDQGIPLHSSNVAESNTTNVTVSNLLDISGPNLEDIEDPVLQNAPKKTKKMKPINSSASTSPSGSTKNDTQASLDSGNYRKNDFFNEEELDLFNRDYFFDYDQVPDNTPRPKGRKGDGCSQEEKRLKKELIQVITRNIVPCLKKDCAFKNEVLSTVCHWLFVTEKELFEHLEKTFNGMNSMNGKNTSAKIASQGELFTAIRNRKLCVIWNPETDIMTKVTWHTIKIFFLSLNGRYYENWVKDWNVKNEEDKKLFLKFREKFWLRFENPDEYMTSADKKKLLQEKR